MWEHLRVIQVGIFDDINAHALPVKSVTSLKFTREITVKDEYLNNHVDSWDALSYVDSLHM